MFNHALPPRLMDYEKRAKIIIRSVIFLIAAIAVTIACLVEIPGLTKKQIGDAHVEGEALPPEQIFQNLINRTDVLTVVNVIEDGNPGSENLSLILRDITEDNVFGDDIDINDYSIAGFGSLAKEKSVDLSTFNGRLDFYAGGRKLGSLNGPSNRVEVEETIRYHLRGLFKRYKKGWRPDVPGMEPAN